AAPSYLDPRGTSSRGYRDVDPVAAYKHASAVTQFAFVRSADLSRARRSVGLGLSRCLTCRWAGGHRLDQALRTAASGDSAKHRRYDEASHLDPPSRSVECSRFPP